MQLSQGSVPPAVESARRWMQRDNPTVSQRDREIERLSTAYEGRLFNLEDSTRPGELSATLKDTRKKQAAQDDAGHRATEIEVNLVRPLIEDWKSVVGIIPTVGIPSRNPGDPEAQRSADLRERIIGATWTASNMVMRFLEGAHAQLLFGSQIPYVVPDPDLDVVEIRVKTPYRAYARAQTDGVALHYLGFQTDEDSELLFDLYPNLHKVIKGEKRGDITVYPDEFTVTEWMDKDHRFFLVDGQWIEDLPYVEHKWGFVPGVVIPNVVGTGNIWSHPEVTQVIGIAQIMSETISMAHDGLFQQVYDTPVLFDDRPVTQLTSGPYEALQLSSDAKIQMLHGGQSSPEVSQALATLERYFRLVGGWPSVLSSELDSSIVTGKAFVAAQGPVSARAAVKHLVMAACYQRINSFALAIWEKVFRNQKMELFRVDGSVPLSMFPNAGRNASEFVTFQPKKDIAGQYENTLSFNAAGTDQYRHIISLLQLKEAEVLSTEYVRQSIPGVDSKEETARIEAEFQRKIQRELGAQQAAMQAQAQQQMQMMAAQQQMAGAGQQQAQAPGQPGGAPPPPQEQAAQPPAALRAIPGGRGEQQAPQQAPQSPSRSTPTGNRITLQQARDQFTRVKPVRGRIFLGGAIVEQGYSEGPIDVFLTEANDWSAILSQTRLGAQKRLVRHVMRKTEDGTPDMPNEQVIEVTPAGAQEVA
jgi:hypothetical protein